jgi:nitronate monooxygenase
MVYPAGEGVGAVRGTATAAEIIQQIMSQANDIPTAEHSPLEGALDHFTD